jgi:hypothetical protein
MNTNNASKSDAEKRAVSGKGYFLTGTTPSRAHTQTVTHGTTLMHSRLLYVE